MQRICVYCGSGAGRNQAYAETAKRLGAELARRGLGLVYGGGGIGLMGRVANAVLEAGGEVIGIIPHALATREVAHQGVGDLRIVSTMHERKRMMAELSDGFIAMPGGLGTFEELFETWTWAQLGIHEKPVGLLDSADYFGPLLGALDHSVREGFVRPVHRDMLLVDTDPAKLLDRFESYQGPDVQKWLLPSEI